ncbi:MAG: hypothetical protein IJW67_05915 [Blautia sp.]|nr:hypothetical protein [Blautia sp.]
MANIIINEKGQKVVEIDTIIFSSKRKIDWDGVEKYLKKYVGQRYRLDETDDIIYIGSDFPDEYANSRYSTKALGTIGKAKAIASQVIPELIQVATHVVFRENSDEKHIRNARFGWYRCTVRFSLPTCDDKGNIIGKNAFQGRMIIRFDEDGNKYLYDIIDIKKET